LGSSKNIFYLEQYIVEIGRYLAIVKPNQFLGFQDLSDLRNVNNCMKFEINNTNRHNIETMHILKVPFNKNKRFKK